MPVLYLTCFTYVHHRNNHSHIVHSMQVLGKVNVNFVFGAGERPKPKRKKGAVQEYNAAAESECLIYAYAACDIAAGSELLASYGAEFWKSGSA